MHRPDIAVVGAGLSGVLTALGILEAAGGEARVHLIEKARRFGVGAAYGTQQPDHLLNVRAANMSADPDQPQDFMVWLSRRRAAPLDPFAFVSRAEYGAYIQDRLRRVAQATAGADRLHLVGDDVVAVERRAEGWSLQLGMGRELAADAVVLAIGNAPPSHAVLPDPGFRRSPAYIGDPWSASLGAVEPDDAVLLLGTGLTMIDVIATLDARGHQGRILALSRRGLLPHVHAPVTGEAAPWRRGTGEALSAGVRRFRREAAASPDWRALFDSLRPSTQDLWKGLSTAERRRFLRHLRPWWYIHRHRLAPAMAARLDTWLSTRLEVAAARLISLDADGGVARAGWRYRGEHRLGSGRFRHVINCTGPEGRVEQSEQPLVRQLLRDGLARPDALALGLDVTDDSRVIGADGTAYATFFAVGPATRGALWEVTAAPDIRVQARRVGELAASIAPQRQLMAT